MCTPTIHLKPIFISQGSTKCNDDCECKPMNLFWRTEYRDNFQPPKCRDFQQRLNLERHRQCQSEYSKFGALVPLLGVSSIPSSQKLHYDASSYFNCFEKPYWQNQKCGVNLQIKIGNVGKIGNDNQNICYWSGQN